MSRDEPGGYLLTDQVVSGVEVARAWFQALVRNVGTWPLIPNPALHVVTGLARARPPSGRNREGLSSDAGDRGGPSRSSGEGPVIGLERRGRVVRAGLAVNRSRAGGAG